jgi:hypothetical protein
MITVILIILAIIVGAVAIGCGGASGIAMEHGDRRMMRFAAGSAFALQAVALALMWWAH